MRTLATSAAAGKGPWQSFGAAKRELGPAGSGKNWEHIVEQCQGNAARSGFAPTQINSTKNLRNVDAWVNAEKAAYYSSKPRAYGGKTVRNWLNGQSFDKQWEFGNDILDRIEQGLPLPGR